MLYTAYGVHIVLVRYIKQCTKNIFFWKYNRNMNICLLGRVLSVNDPSFCINLRDLSSVVAGKPSLGYMWYPSVFITGKILREGKNRLQYTQSHCPSKMFLYYDNNLGMHLSLRNWWYFLDSRGWWSLKKGLLDSYFEKEIPTKPWNFYYVHFT